jgi:hypothetical protein
LSPSVPARLPLENVSFSFTVIHGSWQTKLAEGAIIKLQHPNERT